MSAVVATSRSVVDNLTGRFKAGVVTCARATPPGPASTVSEIGVP